MHKNYCAKEILKKTEQNWPEAGCQVNKFAVYMLRIQTLLQKNCSEDLQARRLNTSEFDVLASLRVTEPPYVLTPTELQKLLLITSGGLTKILYQLESRGLISRSVQEQDKRSKLVHLTAEGQALVEEIMCHHNVEDEKLLAEALTQEELSTFNQLLSKLANAYEKRDGTFTDADSVED